MKELDDSWMGLGTTWDLLRMSVSNTILVNWRRGDIMGKLVVGGRGSRSGGLAGFNHADSSSTSDFFHLFRRACMVEVILTLVLHILLILIWSRGYNNFDLSIEHQVEAVATGGFFKTGKTRSIAPLIQLPTKCLGFDLDHAKFTSSNQPVTPGSVDMGNRGVDDGGL